MQDQPSPQSAAPSRITPPTIHETQRLPTRERRGASLARHAAAARELPFSALFYWID